MRPRFVIRVEVMPNESLSDEDLMRRYFKGDQAAFEIVYRRRRDGLRRFFGRNTGSMAIGTELAQEVWMKLIRAIQNEGYTAEAKFTTYLYRIARNQLIDWYRKNRGQEIVEFDEDVEVGTGAAEYYEYQVQDPERIYADRERLNKVLTGISKLSTAQRTALLMYVEGDMSYEDIAEATGANRETVKTRLRYARQHLKKLVFEEV